MKEVVAADVYDLISSRELMMHFQPIVSVRRQNIIGYEALARLYDHSQQSILAPLGLFQSARESGLALEVDQLCREKAVETFRQGIDTVNPAVLFMNIDPTVIQQEVVGSGHVLDLVRRNGLEPHSVVIELIESEAIDFEALLQFVNFYRSQGFLIAIDDLGNGYSNLDRLLQFRPDIVKIDRSLVDQIDLDYYKQSTFKALVRLAHKIGAVVVAEGIERKEEALTCLSFGADWLQGYYFSRPQKLEEYQSSGPMKCKLLDLGNHFQEIKLNKIRHERDEQQKYQQIMHTLTELLQLCSEEFFEEQLKKVVNLYPGIEYVYVLDELGVQQTDSIRGPHIFGRKKSKLYRSAAKGANQSLKDYYLYIRAGATRFMTDRYLSLATGNVCVTYSQIFQDRLGHNYVLCADFTPIDIDDSSC